MGAGHRAFFDAADVNRTNTKHFSFSSSSDIDTLGRQDRTTIWQRATYEIANNSYFRGILNTFANDLVGSGPRLQLDSGNTDFDTEAENKFTEWANRCDFMGRMSFAEILRLAVGIGQCERGESFTVLRNDPAVRAGIRLRLMTISPERVTNPYMQGDSETLHDGIEFDEYGRPVRYTVCRSHPGSAFAGMILDYDVLPASQVIHLFRQDYPEQSRGIPWIQSSLPLAAQMRRVTLATADATETAANISGIIHSNDPDITDSEELASNDVLDVERNALLTLPNGYDVTQLKPEQPAATYEMFKRELLNEIARPIDMPYNIAAANSKDYNYASGRLDHQGYDSSLRTIQRWAERRLINIVFAAWLDEAYLLPGYFQSNPAFEEYVAARQNPQWFWQKRKHVDPVKEADAQRKRLESGTTTLAEEYAEQGKDWQREVRQRLNETKYILDTAAQMNIPAELALPLFYTQSQPAAQEEPAAATNPNKDD